MSCPRLSLWRSYFLYFSKEVLTISQNQTLVRNLTNGSVSKQLITFAFPLLISGFLQTAYNMVDMVIVGQFVNKSGLAAVSLGADILHLLTFIAMGFSSAGQVIIAQYVGAERHEEISKLIGTLFTFLLSCAIVMTVVFFFLCDHLLVWINTSADAMSYAHDYTIVCISGLFFIYGYNLVSAILRGMGDSVHPFMFIAVAAVLNMILDLVFVAGFNMGTFGAALATVIGQGVSFIWALVFFYRRKEQFGFDFKLKSFKIHKDLFAPLIKLGIPMVIQSAAISISKLYVYSWINIYGTAATAVTGAGAKLSTIANIFAQAMATASAAMIGQCIGAEKFDRVSKVMSISFVLDLIVASLLSIIIFLAPDAVFGMFTSESDVLSLAREFVPAAVLIFISCAFRAPMFALINASGNSILNLVSAILDGFIARIGFSLIMGITLNMGIRGFWYGDAIAGYMPFVIGGIFYVSGKWKTRKHIIKD